MSEKEKKEQNTPRKRTSLYRKKIKHVKKSRTFQKQYEEGKKRDIQAYLEAKKDSKSRIKPSDIPDEIKGLKFKKKKYSIPDKETRKKSRYEFESETRVAFIMDLAEKQADKLEKVGLTKAQINGMKQGNGPKGFHVHHIVPIHGGGKNEFSNLCLVQIKEHQDFHSKYINPQIRGMEDGQSRMIKVPYPEGGIYVSRVGALNLKLKAAKKRTKRRNKNNKLLIQNKKRQR